MTVVPADHLMMLICDGCGDSVTGAGATLPDAEVVWTLVFEHDWVGSPFASGPHHCPRCSVRATVAEDGLGTEDLEQVAGTPAAADVDPAEAVRRAIAERSVRGDRELVDLSALEVIDSAGLGLLVRAHQDARRDGRRLCLLSPSRFVLTVLHTMRLDGVFTVVDGRAPAPGSASRRAVMTEQKEPSPW
ncbi:MULTISPECIES: STAS domain-containing protein [Micromonospora]|uniref:STAS domain-containing protein n=1 Tax=Micromonospora TaxID=1873 RepID=UPI000CE2EEA5|nr:MULTISPECIES: STAS domain-containing protein [Micromonospora]MBQ1066698.1 STAS domain-containing protein [Micromonospora sp. D75]PPA61844.1 anti-anti-sigma factor [Micromonospora chalcea]RBQ06355.1 anti-sigma factor antagonist [Micromonospora sp. LHW51205]